MLYTLPSIPLGLLHLGRRHPGVNHRVGVHSQNTDGASDLLQETERSTMHYYTPAYANRGDVGDIRKIGRNRVIVVIGSE